jgi:LuxR family glucitol operon transcriptional activator
VASYSVSRLTLFAVISSFEEDLRTLVFDSLGAQMSIPELFDGNDDLFARIQKRHREDSDSISENPTLRELLNYSDFADSNQLLQKYRSSLSSPVQIQLPAVNDTVVALAPIRNRVMHTRPLHFDDLARTLDSVDELLRRNRSLWIAVDKTLSLLKNDPSFVLSLDLPPRTELEPVSHNLPIPDFDETGFIGRDEQLKRLRLLCQGPYPVITIVGEGGIGKTALALRIAYEILDYAPQQFDAVVWTTAKTTMLTTKQIIEIEGAISDSLGMLRVASDTLSGPSSSDPVIELLEYLSTFRIFLVLDNLETVLDERLRNFLARLPQGSKVLITSRVGVGAYEHPLKLDPLTNHEAVQLLRALTKSRGLHRLLNVSNKIVSGYCEQMKNNPGYIKWFVSAVQAGARPEEVLSNPTLFLDFCMSNIYNFLSEESRSILQTLQYVSGARSQAELAFLSRLDSVSLQRALQVLLTTNMVNMVPIPKGASFQSRYELSELARDYLAKRHPVPNTIAFQLKERRRELANAAGEIAAGRRTNPYSMRTIHVRSPSDYIVAKYLTDSMSAVNSQEYEKAEQLVLEAKRLAPEFHEVHRVEAFLRIAQDNFTAAATCYEGAVDIEPNSAALHLWYGGFLLRYLDDSEGALREFAKAAELDEGAIEIQSELARAYLHCGDFDSAESTMRKLLKRVIPSERLQRMVFDSMLQLYQRKAERSAGVGDYMQAIDTLGALKNSFEGIPEKFRDLKMLQKLLRAKTVARGCTRNVSDASYKRRAAELETWFISQVNREGADQPNMEDLHGQIRRWYPDKRFGFIMGPRGQEYFFHLSSVISPHHLEDIHEGDRVTFNPENALKGNRAANVEIADLMGR